MIEYVGIQLDEFWYLSLTWTRSPSCTRSLSGTRSSVWTGIALKCNLGSPGLSRHPTSCRNISRGRILVGVGVLIALGVLKWLSNLVGVKLYFCSLNYPRCADQVYRCLIHIWFIVGLGFVFRQISIRRTQCLLEGQIGILVLLGLILAPDIYRSGFAHPG